MARNATDTLDDIAWALVRALHEDARLSFAELGRRVGLSPAAAAERVRRLEEQRVIRGYCARLDAPRLGYAISAFVRLRVTAQRTAEVYALAGQWPEVRECHAVTGDDTLILRVAARSIPHLDRVIERLSRFGQTATSIVLSSVVEDRPIDGPLPSRP